MLCFEAWLAEYSFLQIRASSQHAQCSTCIRHRHMIKHLSHHLRARTQQQKFYWSHLHDQYLDRMVYYGLRSQSRSRDGRSICIIQDGLDQSKVALPRSAWMKGKDFSTFNRPKLHISLTLVHGYFLLWTISNPDTPKDSNASVETFCHALHLLERDHGVVLARAHIHIQCDNTAREIKNNHCLRWASLQVSCGNVGGMSIRCLRCGHSHEDVDQCFGRLARHLSKLRKAECPEDFQRSISQFANAMHRPHESSRYTVIMNETRDWNLDYPSRIIFQISILSFPL